MPGAKPDFAAIKQSANGMLSTKAYEKIHGYACSTRTGDIVEVGTAHGAATVCLALGVQTSGRRVFTFDRILGGSRERFGGVEENLRIIRRNIAAHGVEDTVELIVGNVSDKHREAGGDGPIGLLMLDADGAVDRDFGLFYNRLLPGSPVIIDDFDDTVRVKHLAGKRRVRIDLKHKLTVGLVSYYMSRGMLEQESVVDGTFFGRKPREVHDDIDFRRLDVIPVYRSLVFTEGELPWRWKDRLYEYLERHPRVHDVLRVMKRHLLPGAAH